MMAVMAKLEKDFMKERQKDGIRRFLDNGGKNGRPPKLSPEKAEEIYQEHKAGLSIPDISKKYGITYNTTWKYIDDLRKKKGEKTIKKYIKIPYITNE